MVLTQLLELEQGGLVFGIELLGLAERFLVFGTEPLDQGLGGLLFLGAGRLLRAGAARLSASLASALDSRGETVRAGREQLRARHGPPGRGPEPHRDPTSRRRFQAGGSRSRCRRASRSSVSDGFDRLEFSKTLIALPGDARKLELDLIEPSPQAFGLEHGLLVVRGEFLGLSQERLDLCAVGPGALGQRGFGLGKARGRLNELLACLFDLDEGLVVLTLKLFVAVEDLVALTGERIILSPKCAELRVCCWPLVP